MSNNVLYRSHITLDTMGVNLVYVVDYIIGWKSVDSYKIAEVTWLDVKDAQAITRADLCVDIRVDDINQWLESDVQVIVDLAITAFMEGLIFVGDNVSGYPSYGMKIGSAEDIVGDTHA